MQQDAENKPVVNPYLADDELRAKYPDVDFDQQEAHHSRRNYIINKIHLHGRDRNFLLALIFSDPDAIGCCKTLRNIITDYRQYVTDCYRTGVPYEKVQFIDVDELRTIVYRYHPEVNTIDMYVKLINEVDALNRQIYSLIADYAKLRKDFDELKAKYDAVCAELTLYKSGRPKAKAKKPDATEVLLEQEAQASGQEREAGEKAPEEQEEAPLTLKLKLTAANDVVIKLVNGNKTVCAEYVNRLSNSQSTEESVGTHTRWLFDGGWVPEIHKINLSKLAGIIAGFLPDAEGNSQRTVRRQLTDLVAQYR